MVQQAPRESGERTLGSGGGDTGTGGRAWASKQCRRREVMGCGCGWWRGYGRGGGVITGEIGGEGEIMG